MPGPKRTPTVKLELVGSQLAPARVLQREPQPTADVMATPEWITADPVALELWESTIDRLVGMGLASHTDARAVERYIRDLIEWDAMRIFIAAQPSSRAYATKDKDGNVVGVRSIPQLKTINDLGDRLLKLEREFGLTPSARASLSTNATPINDKKGSFLDGNKRTSTG